MNKPKIRKAVLPVAGLGTRFLPATKVLPKEMMIILNKPVIQYVVEEAMNAGIEEFIFVTGRGKVIIEDHFDISYELEQHLDKNNKQDYKELIKKGIPKPGKAFFTRQQHPMGLGHAVWCAQALVEDEPFAVLLPDEFLGLNSICLKEMIDIYDNTTADMVLAVQEVSWDDVSSYGIVRTTQNKTQGDNLIVESLIEKPTQEKAPSNLAIIGRYILQPSIFKHLEKAQKGVGGEIQLTDSIDSCINEYTTAAYLYKNKRFDCGNPLGLLEASLDVALSKESTHDKTKQIIEKLLSKY